MAGSFDEAPVIEDDPLLRQRVQVFESGLHVLGARRYAHGPRDCTADVYLVRNDADQDLEVHLLEWREPAGEWGTHMHDIASGLNHFASNQLVFLDLEGDGHREIIILRAGANFLVPAILDFRRPKGEREVLPGITALKGEPVYTFYDLDGDGRYECIAETDWLEELGWVGEVLPANKVSPPDRLRGYGEEAAYLVHELRGEEYVLVEVTLTNPIPPDDQLP
jgi:hypothetical protein